MLLAVVGCNTSDGKAPKPTPSGSDTAAQLAGDCKPGNAKAHDYRPAKKHEVGESKLRRVSYTFNGRGARVEIDVRFKPRFPKKVRGKLPLVVWSHGGGPDEALRRRVARLLQGQQGVGQSARPGGVGGARRRSRRSARLP